jgi:SOS response regulatory protein OraA/RecX
VSLEDRVVALERLERAGYVDDRRVAEARAAALAGRGSGDALIRDDLGRRGIGDDLAEAAIAALEPELVRAERVLARRGGGPKTVRYLASRGFGEETLEVIARETEGAVG